MVKRQSYISCKSVPSVSGGCPHAHTGVNSRTRGSGIPPGCNHLWSPCPVVVSPELPKRPPATLCQPSGLDWPAERHGKASRAPALARVTGARTFLSNAARNWPLVWRVTCSELLAPWKRRELSSPRPDGRSEIRRRAEIRRANISRRVAPPPPRDGAT